MKTSKAKQMELSLDLIVNFLENEETKGLIHEFSPEIISSVSASVIRYLTEKEFPERKINSLSELSKQEQDLMLKLINVCFMAFRMNKVAEGVCDECKSEEKS